jgi:hypothetical protein
MNLQKVAIYYYSLPKNIHLVIQSLYGLSVKECSSPDLVC